MLRPVHRPTLSEDWRWVKNKNFEPGQSALTVYFDCGSFYYTKQDPTVKENITTSAAKKLNKKQYIHYCNFELHIYIFIYGYVYKW